MNSKIRSVLRSMKRSEPGWKYGSNIRSTLSYGITPKGVLKGTEKAIVDELNSTGIAITSLDRLLSGESEFRLLASAVDRLVEHKRQEIDYLKSHANDETAIGIKTFNLECLGSELTFDADSAFARFALNDSLLNIANAYFRMHAKLRYYNVWYTAASSGKARESQLWHFDREDFYILKVFLYLDDVDEGAGPLTYAPGTHKKGKYYDLNPEFFVEGGVRRTTDDQMKAVYSEDKWVRAVGKKGTIVFADTRGFHKGGEARTKDRLMFTSMYTSPASESKNLIHFAENFDKAALDRRRLRALGLK